MIRFEPVENFSTTNSIIRLTWDNKIVIPIVASYPMLPDFNIKTFVSLTKNAAEGLGYAYDPVNSVFERFSIAQQKTIAESLLLMHIEILKAPNVDSLLLLDKTKILKDISILTSKLGNILDLLDQEVNLCEVILEYVREEVPIPDMKDAGTKPQHSEEMTFSKEEATVITAHAVLMKILTAITGTFVHKYRDIIPKDKKEIYSFSITDKLFGRKYSVLMKKIIGYIRTLLQKAYTVSPTTQYSGQTLDTLTLMTHATIYTKRFVGMYLFKVDGNIIRYISSCCSMGQTSSHSTISRESIKIITGPRDRPDMEEGNCSTLETESAQSIRPAGMITDIKVAMLRHCKYLIESENIPQEYLDSAHSYYSTNGITMTPLSQYILSSYYGRDIGGGASIEILRYIEVVHAIVVLQYILSKLKLPNLVHALTFKVSDHDRVQTNEDYAFINTWRGQPEYAQCRKAFPAGFGLNEWNTDFNKISDYLIKKSITYSTAPVVWDLLGSEIQNGRICTPTEYTDVMVELMRVVRILFLGSEGE